MRSPAIGSCQTGRPASVTQWRTPPESWCMPSPNTIRLPATAGDDTDASLRYGAVRDHAGFGSPVPSAGYSATVGRLNAPSPATYTFGPTGTGDATKWSCDFTTHSTTGFSGPGLPSVFPVRCGLPRYVAHGSAAGEE